MAVVICPLVTGHHHHPTIGTPKVSFSQTPWSMTLIQWSLVQWSPEVSLPFTLMILQTLLLQQFSWLETICMLSLLQVHHCGHSLPGFSRHYGKHKRRAPTHFYIWTTQDISDNFSCDRATWQSVINRVCRIYWGWCCTLALSRLTWFSSSQTSTLTRSGSWVWEFHVAMLFECSLCFRDCSQWWDHAEA